MNNTIEILLTGFQLFTVCYAIVLFPLLLKFMTNFNNKFVITAWLFAFFAAITAPNNFYIIFIILGGMTITIYVGFTHSRIEHRAQLKVQRTKTASNDDQTTQTPKNDQSGTGTQKPKSTTRLKNPNSVKAAKEKKQNGKKPQGKDQLAHKEELPPGFDIDLEKED